jgi:hypothetical protein
MESQKYQSLMHGCKEYALTACLLINAIRLSTSATSPESFVLSGNPWGVTFEETIATGFALERVELMGSEIWEITARLSIFESSAYITDQKISAAHVPVIFIAPPMSVLPTENNNVQPFLNSNISPHINTPWILHKPTDNGYLNRPQDYFIMGNFSYTDIPSSNDPRSTTQPHVTTRVSLTEQHPIIDDTAIVRITIPHTAIEILSLQVGDESSRDIIVGVALISISGDKNLDRIYSGKVRLMDTKNTPIIRSFTAVTSTRYTFITHTTLQIVETLIDSVWTYVAIITFGLQAGITSPVVDLSRSFFAIATSITTTDEWKPFHCPSAPIARPNGCVMDIFPHNAPFCTVETIDVSADTPPAYRIRVKLGEYASQPSPSDNIYIRMMVEGVENGATSISFMNIQTPLLASSVRCGAVLMTDPTDQETFLYTDPIKMTTYSGIMLLPMTQDGRDAPLISSTIAYPITVSSVANLHARSILDSLVTIALIGRDDEFPELSGKTVSMVDLVSVHVRDDSTFDILNSMVHTGAAFSVNSTTKQLTISSDFDTVCRNDPNLCAQRLLMRNSVLLMPDHVRTDTDILLDTAWIDTLFNDYDTDKNIAQTFTKNVYDAISPNNVFRRFVWVDSTYTTWPPIQMESFKDHVLILASFDIIQD